MAYYNRNLEKFAFEDMNMSYLNCIIKIFGGNSQIFR